MPRRTTDLRNDMKIHALNCGYIRVHKDLPYGGGSIMMVNLPGHTDGLCGVLVRDGEKYVLLASDAAVSPRSWEMTEPPGFAADPALQRKSLSWIAETASDTACITVLCSHDKEMEPETIEF